MNLVKTKYKESLNILELATDQNSLPLLKNLFIDVLRNLDVLEEVVLQASPEKKEYVIDKAASIRKAFDALYTKIAYSSVTNELLQSIYDVDFESTQSDVNELVAYL